MAWLCLLAGVALLGAVCYYLNGKDSQLAQQVGSAGLCVLLTAVGLCVWIPVRRELKDLRRRAEEEADDEDSELPGGDAS